MWQRDPLHPNRLDPTHVYDYGPGERVVQGQRVMQAASDMFLGWQRVSDIDGKTRDYYVRQLHDWKGSVDVETMRLPAAMLYAQVCGR